MNTELLEAMELYLNDHAEAQQMLRTTARDAFERLYPSYIIEDYAIETRLKLGMEDGWSFHYYKPRTVPVPIQLWVEFDTPVQITAIRTNDEILEIAVDGNSEFVHTFVLDKPMNRVIKAYVVQLKHVATVGEHVGV